MTSFSERFNDAIRIVPDFPKKGISFKDITPILADAELFQQTIDWACERIAALPRTTDYIVGIDARGFILGAAVANKLGKGFIPVRKRNKLPAATYQAEYELEYGVDALEIHKDALPPGSHAAVIDDLLATGGTAEATARLVEQCGAKISGFLFLIELEFLDGVEKLTKYQTSIETLVKDKG